MAIRSKGEDVKLERVRETENDLRRRLEAATSCLRHLQDLRRGHPKGALEMKRKGAR